MRLGKLAKPTGVIRAGDTVRMVLNECVRADVGGLPFVDSDGKLQGRLSIRNIMRERCIPSYLLKAAHLVGDNADFSMPEAEVKALLDSPADEFVLPNVGVVSCSTPIIKGMAIMEQFSTSYLFLVHDGEYQGIVTRMMIARRILEVHDVNGIL